MLHALFSNACVLCCVLACFQYPASCQGEFEAAHALILQVNQDRANLEAAGGPEKAPQQKEHLAEQIKSLPERVGQLLAKGMLQALNSGTISSASQLQQQVRDALRVGTAGDESGKDAFVFALGSEPRPSYFVAYDVSYCAICSISWIGIIGPKREAYAVLDSLKDPLPNRSIDVVPLGAPHTRDRSPAFLVFGTLWGDGHRRMSAALYAVAGQQLKRMWSASDLIEGEITVSGEVAIVRSYTTLRPPFVWRTQVYSLSADGLKLESASETPAN